MDNPAQQNNPKASGHNEVADRPPDAAKEQLPKPWDEQRQHRWNKATLRSATAAIVDVDIAHLVVPPDVAEECDDA
ncbi:MAG: hypothetical protein AB1656_15530 [Candidatus Omnitrophota bacterium]